MRRTPILRPLPALLLALAGTARADLLNAGFEDSGVGLPPANWNPVNTTTVTDGLAPPNKVAQMLGTALSPATITQQFTCDDVVAGLTVCELSFRYRFGTAGFGTLTPSGQNGGTTIPGNPIVAPNDTLWHTAKFRFNDPSCGMTLAVRFTAVETVYLDDVTDACVAPIPEPSAFAAFALGGVTLLRRRRSRSPGPWLKVPWN